MHFYVLWLRSCIPLREHAAIWSSTLLCLTSGWLPVWDSSNQAAENILCVSVQNTDFSLLGKYMGEEWLNHMVGICLIFKNCQIIFQSRWIVCAWRAPADICNIRPPAPWFVWRRFTATPSCSEHRHEGWMPIEPKDSVAFTQNTIILHLWRAVWCSKTFHTDYLKDLNHDWM